MLFDVLSGSSQQRRPVPEVADTHVASTTQQSSVSTSGVTVINVEATGCLDSVRVRFVTTDGAPVPLRRTHRFELFDGQTISAELPGQIDCPPAWIRRHPTGSVLTFLGLGSSLPPSGCFTSIG